MSAPSLPPIDEFDVHVIDTGASWARNTLNGLPIDAGNRNVTTWLRIWALMAVERLGRDEAGALLRGAAADAGARLILPRPPARPPRIWTTAAYAAGFLSGCRRVPAFAIGLVAGVVFACVSLSLLRIIWP